MVRLAAIQMVSDKEIKENLKVASSLIKHAAEQGSNFLVLPENFAYMGSSEAKKLEIAEPEGSGLIQDFLSENAVKYGVWIVGGTISIVTNTKNKVRAACLVLDDKGKQRARYDKIHLFDVRVNDQQKIYAESRYVEPGEDIVFLSTPFGKVGLAVCYDIRFPEMFRRMTQEGAEIFAIPAAFTAITGKAHWHTLLRARAIENLCYVVAAAQGGKHENNRQTYGHSMIIDSWGTICDELSENKGVVIAEFDQNKQREIRKNFPVLLHRRIY